MRSTALKGLALSSIGFLASASIGTLLAIAHDLPARFGGLLSGTDVLRDFLLLNGTALSPDLALLLVQLLLIGCVLSAKRISMVGVIGLTALGACYTLGQLGEPIMLHSLTPASFNAEPAAIAVINLVCSTAMFVFGIREWRGRWQARGSKELGLALRARGARHFEVQAGGDSDHRS
jgi:hypothetical protein